MTKKIFASIIMVMVAFASLATVTYAWWAAIINGPNPVTQDVTVKVGTADDVETKINLSAILSQTNGTLVPAGRAAVSPGNPVEEVTFNQEITWNETIADPASGSQINPNEDTVTATLTVSVNTIEIDGSTDNEDLVNIFIKVDGVWEDLRTDREFTVTIETLLTLEFKVTLTEPANSTEYAAVAGKDITFTINYAVDEVETPNV